MVALSESNSSGSGSCFVATLDGVQKMQAYQRSFPISSSCIASTFLINTCRYSSKILIPCLTLRGGPQRNQEEYSRERGAWPFATERARSDGRTGREWVSAGGVWSALGLVGAQWHLSTLMPIASRVAYRCRCISPAI